MSVFVLVSQSFLVFLLFFLFYSFVLVYTLFRLCSCSLPFVIFLYFCVHINQSALSCTPFVLPPFVPFYSSLFFFFILSFFHHLTVMSVFTLTLYLSLLSFLTSFHLFLSFSNPSVHSFPLFSSSLNPLTHSQSLYSSFFPLQYTNPRKSSPIGYFS